MTERFLTICVACTKGVTRDNMQYVNGRVFHPECYQKYGNDFLVVDQDLARRTRRLKIELVQLKNLKSRKKVSSPTKSKLKQKSSKKSKKTPSKIKSQIKKKAKKLVKRTKVNKRKNKTRSKRR